MTRPPDADGDAQGARSPARGTPEPVDLSADRRVRLTWAVLVAGPVIWFGHFMLVYLIAEMGCTGDGHGLDLFDPPVPVIATAVATAIALPLAAAAALWAWRWWRANEDALDAAPDEAHELSGDFDDDRRRGSLAFAGLLLSAFSIIAILFTAAPATVLGPC